MAIRRKSVVRLVGVKRAADTETVVHPEWQFEDEFGSLYSAHRGGNVILEPTFNPLQLMALTFRNSVLQQCIHAMEVNIDGTGYNLEVPEGKAEDQAEKDRLEAFFNEPFPGMSFITMRRKLRVEMEQVGYGFLEVVTNIENAVAFLRNIDVATVRLIQYDAPVQIEKEIERNGETVKAKFFVRERRFVQKIGQSLVYFREYGSSRQLDRLTGKWEKEGEPIPLERRASQLAMFVVDNDPTTPYGLPRWINNTPAVLGTRKSEEFNLEFFDSGGLPPAIVFIQGGTLTKIMEEQLLHYLGGGAKSKFRAAVVAVQSSGGSLETAPGKVDVRVERFGDSRQSDAMFQTYEANNDEKIRASFRLPPIFLGKAQDYSFASAMTSYKVAEAQVFAPERMEFDEIINHTVMRGLNAKTYQFKSKPIILKDVQVQMEALLGAKEKITGEEFIATMNELTGLTLVFSQEAEDAANARLAAANQAGAFGTNATQEGASPAGGGAGTPPRANIQRSVTKSAAHLLDLAEKFVVAVGLERGVALTAEESKSVMETVRQLQPEETLLFNRIVSSRAYTESMRDPDGLAEIAGCAAAAMIK